MRVTATFFLPATVTRCASLWPCTSALGESTRSSSAGSAKLSPSSKLTVSTRLSLSSLSSVGQLLAIATPLSAEVDIALDHVIEPGTLRGKHHLHFQFALAAEFFLAHHAFDLLLGGDADLLERLPERHIEPLLIHAWPPEASCPVLWNS